MTPGRSPVPLYVVTVIVAACSLLYELLVAQTMTLLAANIVVWYSLTVGTYLLSMGLGSLVCDRICGRRGAWEALFSVEIALVLAGGLAVIVVHLAHILHAHLSANDHEAAARIVFFGAALAVTFVVGALTGLELPLLIRAGNELAPGTKLTNRVLGVDYVGGVLAGVGFPLVLLPRMEVLTIGLLASALNLLVATYLGLRLARQGKGSARRLLAIAACAVPLALGLGSLDRLEQYFLQKYYYYLETYDSLGATFLPASNLPRVPRRSSPYQKIDIVEAVDRSERDELIRAYSTKRETEPLFPRGVRLFLNGDYQVSSDDEEIYHEYLAHVPVALAGTVPERVLVLGAGDGLLARELVKYDGIARIVVVDIDPVLVDIARHDPVFTTMNHDALDDPRVEVVVGDAYQFVRRDPRLFDAVFVDFPYVVDYNLAKLYSVEFFRFLRRRMAPGAFVALNCPSIGDFEWPDARGAQAMSADNDWPYYAATLAASGFRTIRPYVSNLETDNPRAFDLLKHWRADPEDGPKDRRDSAERRARELAEAVIGHSLSLQYGFVYLSDDDRSEIRPWRELGVPLHVLDERRYRLAFALDFPPAETIDERKANSIMRPTLPTLPFWYTRLPW